jgi:indolepyruvate ferredoxin oxidoreductase
MVSLDATALAEQLFGSHMPGNLILVGVAYQAGLIPVSAAAIKRAIALNGVQVETNRQAFRVGRRAVADPGWAATLAGALRPGALAIAPKLTPPARALIEQVAADGELRRLLEVRVPELIAFQDLAYAQTYCEFVRRVCEAERWLPGGETRLSEAVARSLFKLMAYKDEYEVARLHLRPEAAEAVRRQFGEGASVRYQLHPPLLRSLGLRHKIGVGRWVEPLFRLLIWLRRLRGTPFDPFGYTEVRRVERSLIGEYRDLIEQALPVLTPETYDQVVRLAELPDLVRGYEAVKLKNVARYRAEVEKLRRALLKE